MLSACEFLAALEAARLDVLVIGSDADASIVMQPFPGADVSEADMDDLIGRLDWNGTERDELVRLLTAGRLN